MCYTHVFRTFKINASVMRFKTGLKDIEGNIEKVHKNTKGHFVCYFINTATVQPTFQGLEKQVPLVRTMNWKRYKCIKHTIQYRQRPTTAP